MSKRLCRHCHNPLTNVFLDLGFAPPSNAYLQCDDLSRPERHFPLKLYVCERCWLVQTEDYAQCDELFTADYAYFSSTSQSWLDHAADYFAMISRRLGLTEHSYVVELAANDGYLLKNAVKAGIPCLGIEPTAQTAATAEKLGIPVIKEFFGRTLAERLARDGKMADLLIGNNVYAHVPDINDFTEGMRIILKPQGTITLEFPHLLNLIQGRLFDTVYHEHYSYLSATFVERIFRETGLRLYDLEEIPTHGGSLRVYGCHADAEFATTPAVAKFLKKERDNGLCDIASYAGFQDEVNRIKDDFLRYLLAKKASGISVMGYGAAAKGNTLLNYAGVKPDLLPCVFDAAPSKQGKFLPGSHIPILSPDKIRELHPQELVIFPWNIATELVAQLAYIREWGGEIFTVVPEVKQIL